MTWNGEIAWRPRLRLIGWAPKGEDWKCFFSGLNENAGEHWTETVPMSLAERVAMAVGYGYERNLREALEDSDVYHIETVTDLLKVVLHLPKPFAEILDDIKIPRTRTVYRFRPLVGPMPQFHGPLEPNGLLPHGTPSYKPEELDVQPSFKHIESLPIMGFKHTDPQVWTETLKSLMETHPLKIQS
ncbi:hypothetical protein [Burkholderia phage FLC9]|nr:hypothetical protein [Burkholderia phage FLC9]